MRKDWLADLQQIFLIGVGHSLCMVLSIDGPHPGDGTTVMLPTVTLLLPPLFQDDFRLADFVVRPFRRELLVEENGLENVVL